jgi:hypothetical protein
LKSFSHTNVHQFKPRDILLREAVFERFRFFRIGEILAAGETEVTGVVICNVVTTLVALIVHDSPRESKLAKEDGFEPPLHRFGDEPTAVILFSRW